MNSNYNYNFVHDIRISPENLSVIGLYCLEYWVLKKRMCVHFQLRMINNIRAISLFNSWIWTRFKNNDAICKLLINFEVNHFLLVIMGKYIYNYHLWSHISVSYIQDELCEFAKLAYQHTCYVCKHFDFFRRSFYLENA